MVISSLLLDHSSGDEGKYRYEKADSHALEGGDATVMASDAAEEGDDEALVEGDEDEGVDGSEDGDRARWNYEVGTELSVHDAGLADEEGGKLGEGDGKGNGGGPYWKDSYEAFELLYLSNGAKPPSTGADCDIGDNRCLVQKPNGNA